MESTIESLLDEHFYAIMALGFAFIFRHTAMRIWASYMFLHKGDYKEDDIVIINGRPGRIVRVGMWKTVFFLYDIDEEGMIRGGTKMVVQNDRLAGLTIEKQLQNIDTNKWKKSKEE